MLVCHGKYPGQRIERTKPHNFAVWITDFVEDAGEDGRVESIIGTGVFNRVPLGLLAH
jgi:hypothetical protein